MIDQDSRVDLLLAAVRELLDAGEAPNSLLVRSLLSSASDDREALTAARTFLAEVSGETVDLGEGAVMEMHLRGAGVHGQATSAQRFGSFVRHIAEATKEITKERAHRQRMAADLQITPVFAGSVGVRLVVPVARPAHRTAKLLEHADVESDALRMLGAILSLASEDEVADDLASHLESLPFPARRALRGAVKDQVTARWEINGTVSQEGLDTISIVASERGARRLWDELDREVTETSVAEVDARIDGLRHSLRTVWLDDEAGDRYPVAVPEPSLMLEVAALSAEPDLVVHAWLTITTSTMGGDSGTTRKSRTLQAIEVVESPED